VRRAFPYIATALLVTLLAGVFVLRPTPFIGVTADSMAASLRGKVPAAASIDCSESGEDAWSCDVAGPTRALDRSYEITVNGFGCWTATPVGEIATVATPATLTGCITVFDH
jgi:hypothetical protein